MAKHKEKFSEKYLFSLTELEIGAASAVSNFEDAMVGMLIVLVKLGILPGFWLLK